jgi:glycosyltransferase involved in cell wall biosynthesis
MDEVVGDAALLVRPGDDAQLADTIRELLADHALTARLRSAGPARAKAFTWERSVCAHVDAYRRVR